MTPLWGRKANDMAKFDEMMVDQMSRLHRSLKQRNSAPIRASLKRHRADASAALDLTEAGAAKRLAGRRKRATEAARLAETNADTLTAIAGKLGKSMPPAFEAMVKDAMVAKEEAIANASDDATAAAAKSAEAKRTVKATDYSIIATAADFIGGPVEKDAPKKKRSRKKVAPATTPAA